MRHLYFILAILIYSPLNGQQVTKEFTEILYTENFENSFSSDWKQESNASNMFLLQNGYYNLSRLDKSSGSYILPLKSSKVFSDYEFSATFRFINNQNKAQSVGIMFNAQINGSGALVVEINQKKEFRVRRINTADITNITSQSEDDLEGWLKAKSLNKKGNNTVKIVTYQKVFDIYINDKYLYTFTDIQFSSGKVGLYIGEDSKASIDKMQIKGNKEINLKSTDINTKDTDRLFEAIIIRQRKTIKAKELKIEGIQRELNNCRAYKFVDTASARKKKTLTKRINILEGENQVLSNQLEKLKKDNITLVAFKKEIEGNDDGDVIIALTRATKTLRDQISTLKSEKQALRAENTNLRKGSNSTSMTTAQKQETIDRLTQLVWEKDSALKAERIKNGIIPKEDNPNTGGDYYTDDNEVDPKKTDDSPNTKKKTLFQQLKEEEKNKSNQ